MLPAPPSLLPLYARAAVTGPLRRHTSGDRLPSAPVAVAPQRLDAGHLAAYDRVCGFRYSDVLPPTYLHVLAFPLQVALMGSGDFPFPLVGLVHVHNTIAVHRPVRLQEEVAFSVAAEQLRPHAVGRQFDLVATATVAGEPVWTGRSTYLRREKRPERPAGPRPRAVAAPVEAAVTQVRVPADIGRRYAAVSGDRNPIHLSGPTAKLFGFPSAIAHGMWLAARTLATLEGRLPDTATIDVSFKTPVFLPTTVSVASAPSDAGWTLDVRGVRSGKPHLTGTVSPG